MSDRLLISMAIVLGMLWQQAIALQCAARVCPEQPVQAACGERAAKPPCPKSGRDEKCPEPCNMQRDVPAIPDPTRPQAPAPIADGPAEAVPVPVWATGARPGHLRVVPRETGPPLRSRLCVWNN